MAGWVKLDEGFFLHPKALAAGRDARDLYLAALCWSSQQQTDGLVPAHTLPLIASLAGVPDADQAAYRLCEVRLWENDPAGWVIHDFLAHQQSKEERETYRQRERDRKQAARDALKAQQVPEPVRPESARNPQRSPQDVRSRDQKRSDKTSSSSSSTSSHQQRQPDVDDDDQSKKLNETMDLVGQHLAATNGRSNPQGYAATVTRDTRRRDQMAELITANPHRDPAWLADEHLGRQHPPDECTNCHALYHTADRCPLKDQP